jgi:hypothetical protein
MLNARSVLLLVACYLSLIFCFNQLPSTSYQQPASSIHAINFIPKPHDLLEQFFCAGHDAAGAAVKFHRHPIVNRQADVFHHLAGAQLGNGHKVIGRSKPA